MNYKRHYKDVFTQLTDQNKGVLNEIADNIKRKKLNRLAHERILSDVADMVLDCQKRAVPPEQLIGNDRAAFSDELTENAPRARSAEKVLPFIRNLSALFLLVGVIALAVILVHGNSFNLHGYRAMQVIGAAVVALLFFPLVCYHNAVFKPLRPYAPVSKNVIKLNASQINSKSLMARIIYSLVCVAGTIAYVWFFWLNPEKIMTRRMSIIELNVVVWVLLSAAIFIIALIGAKRAVTRNCPRNDIKEFDKIEEAE